MNEPFGSHVDLTVFGGPVRVYRSGEDGPPVLLLHGAMLDTALGIWHDIVPSLARKYRVYVIDMPRHGASRPWEGFLGDAFYRRFVSELLDRLELQRTAIIGLSLGGGVALGFALDHPDRVSALIPVAPGGLGAKRPYHFLTWASMRFPGLLRMYTHYLARNPGSVGASIEKNLTAGASTPGFGRIVELAIQEAKAKRAYREKALDDWQIDWYGSPRASSVNHIPHLQSLIVPTLWIRGDRDEAIGHDEMHKAHKEMPNSRFVTIADAGHLLPWDQPVKFSTVVHGFLDEVIDDEV